MEERNYNKWERQGINDKLDRERLSLEDKYTKIMSKDIWQITID